MMILGLVVLGVLIWGGFNSALEVTNKTSFCIGCHEMKENVYTQYKESSHFSNSIGVRAECPDCHVPNEWTSMVVRKITASAEVYHKVVGSIDTQEKFEEKHLQLAQKVWHTMQKNDSQECRNCHSYDAMTSKEQSTAAASRHQMARENGVTCVDCHVGITHTLPKEFLTVIHEQFHQENRDCSNCHVSMAPLATDSDDWW